MKNKSTAIDIRNYNRNIIYNLLFQEDDLSQKEIAEKLNLSLPTVIQNLNDLREQNLILELGHYQSTGGRKAKRIALNAMARVALGLDITKNHISLVLLNLTGEILECKHIRLIYRDSSDSYETIATLIKQILMLHNIEKEQILGMGVSLPAIIASDHKTITYSKVITGLPEGALFYEHISSYFSFPILLENDASSGGFAELWFRPSTANIFYLLVSNSIGGAIYFNNTAYTGEHNRSAEIGHTTLIPDGLKCYCGRSGCVDVYCSASLLSEFSEDGTLEGFFNELKMKNPVFIKYWEQYLDYIAMTISNIRLLFDCDIIIGGYVGNYIEPYILDVRKHVMDREIFSENADFVLPCKLHTESSAVGAALIYIDQFKKSI